MLSSLILDTFRLCVNLQPPSFDDGRDTFSVFHRNFAEHLDKSNFNRPGASRVLQEKDASRPVLPWTGG